MEAAGNPQLAGCFLRYFTNITPFATNNVWRDERKRLNAENRIRVAAGKPALLGQMTLFATDEDTSPPARVKTLF
jgi:hypothetical protein